MCLLLLLSELGAQLAVMLLLGRQPLIHQAAQLIALMRQALERGHLKTNLRLQMPIAELQDVVLFRQILAFTHRRQLQRRRLRALIDELGQALVERSLALLGLL